MQAVDTPGISVIKIVPVVVYSILYVTRINDDALHMHGCHMVVHSYS